MAELTAHRVVVHGEVQGVFFRASTRDHAQQLGVTGWVRNNPDGTVETHLEGDTDAVADLEAWIRDGGPRRASVTDLDVAEVDPTGATTFEVR